jgi:hypothetical protein
LISLSNPFIFYSGVGRDKDASESVTPEVESNVQENDENSPSTDVNPSQSISVAVDKSKSTTTDINPSHPFSIDVVVLQSLSKSLGVISQEVPTESNPSSSTANNEQDTPDLGVVLEEKDKTLSSDDNDKSRIRNVSLSTDSGVASEGKDDKAHKEKDIKRNRLTITCCYIKNLGSLGQSIELKPSHENLPSGLNTHRSIIW